MNNNKKFNNIFFDKLKRFLHPRDSYNVLNIGCGENNFISSLNESNIGLNKGVIIDASYTTVNNLHSSLEESVSEKCSVYCAGISSHTRMLKFKISEDNKSGGEVVFRSIDADNNSTDEQLIEFKTLCDFVTDSDSLESFFHDTIDIVYVNTNTHNSHVLYSVAEYINKINSINRPVVLCNKFDSGDPTYTHTIDYYTYNKYQFQQLSDTDITIFFPEERLSQLSQQSNKSFESMVSGVKKPNTTIVTGLWNLERDKLDGWAKREFDDYKKNFFILLEADVPMCVWVSSDLVDDVKRIRLNRPTRIFVKNVEDFETWNPFYERIQQIRTNETWKNTAGWLSSSPQCELQYYNAMMFTKMFMVNDSSIVNPFDTEYFFWLDGGITNTVHQGYFREHNVLQNLDNYMLSIPEDFMFLSYDYENDNEMHGFKSEEFKKLCGVPDAKTISICRGGFWGGHVSKLQELNSQYYGLMQSTLTDGLMGADENLFTILQYQNKDTVKSYKIGTDGLIWPIFEELQQHTEPPVKLPVKRSLTNENTALYIITFNSPAQLTDLLISFEKNDKNFLNKTTKYLLDNSTDLSTTPEYKEICTKYNMEHIKKDNLGICGGRQFIAEHFEASSHEYMMFFEDDFTLNGPADVGVCRNGFTYYVNNIYDKVHDIMRKEKFDYLKMTFSEFFGDNRVQWSWYNVPQQLRESIWPDNCTLPEHGLSPNAPLTRFEHINSIDQLAYISGDVYYCNWPQIVSRDGNKKMFLSESWAHPYEQTWMSYIFQLTRDDKFKPGLLLATPFIHDRKHHYEGSLRKES